LQLPQRPLTAGGVVTEVVMILDERVLESIIAKKLNDLRDAVLYEARKNIDEMGITDEGTLKKAVIMYDVSPTEKHLVFTADYAACIEWGTRPHSVSKEGKERIAGWASRKLGLSEEEAKNAAYAISWKIWWEGSQPKPWLRSAIAKVAATFKY